MLNAGRKTRTETKSLVVYRTNSDDSVPLTAHDLNKVQLELGNLGISYHYVILLNGSIEKGIEIDEVGTGENTDVSVCVIGGKKDKKKMTDEQQETFNKIKDFVYKRYNLSGEVSYV